MNIRSQYTYSSSKKVKINNLCLGDKKIIIIAGPCSIRDRQSFLANIEQTISAGADMIRGGIFKPRTNPDSFQGMGTEAVKIVEEAKEKYNIGYACEVTGETRYLLDKFELPLNKENLSTVTSGKINVLDLITKLADLPWIGSRNGQSYDLIQSLAIEAISKNKPIMLKRGYWMTLEEYCMALRYIIRLGCPTVACLRGIGSHRKYRFTSDIADIHYIKKQMNIPVVVDPSHIAGDWQYVEDLSYEAIQAGADGLIIETSLDRTKELSDKDQAITPDILSNIVKYSRRAEKTAR